MAIAKATIPGLTNDTEYGVRLFVEGKFGYQTALEGATAAATPRAGLKLSEIPEGNFISLNENNTPVLFYVAKHGYEPELNGPGRSLAVRKDCYDNRQWHTSDVNIYANSAINSWLNSDYKSLFESDIQAAIGTTEFYRTPGGNSFSTVSTLQRSVFLLSVTELGLSHTYANVEGSALPIASKLQIAYLNGTSNDQWTRSPYAHAIVSYAWRLSSTGKVSNSNCSNSYGSRPAFTLPSDMLFSLEPNADGSYNPL